MPAGAHAARQQRAPRWLRSWEFAHAALAPYSHSSTGALRMVSLPKRTTSNSEYRFILLRICGHRGRPGCSQPATGASSGASCRQSQPVHAPPAWACCAPSCPAFGSGTSAHWHQCCSGAVRSACVLQLGSHHCAQPQADLVLLDMLLRGLRAQEAGCVGRDGARPARARWHGRVLPCCCCGCGCCSCCDVLCVCRCCCCR